LPTSAASTFRHESTREEGMEKTIFLFKRHKNRDREDFAHHYVTNHAPLGTRLTRCLLGYSVNIVERDCEYDAITEHWVSLASDLLTPEIAYATPEDFEAVVRDDRTLFDGSDLYVATKETYPVPGEPLASPLGAQTPEAKLIWFYGDAAAAPPPPPAARRVVDNHIGYKLVWKPEGRLSIAPDIRLIRMAWGASVEAFGADTTAAIVVREHCFIAPPRWPSN
jgi:hypothetical protein